MLRAKENASQSTPYADNPISKVIAQPAGQATSPSITPAFKIAWNPTASNSKIIFASFVLTDSSSTPRKSAQQ